MIPRGGHMMDRVGEFLSSAQSPTWPPPLPAPPSPQLPTVATRSSILSQPILTEIERSVFYPLTERKRSPSTSLSMGELYPCNPSHQGHPIEANAPYSLPHSVLQILWPLQSAHVACLSHSSFLQPCYPHSTWLQTS